MLLIVCCEISVSAEMSFTMYMWDYLIYVGKGSDVVKFQPFLLKFKMFFGPRKDWVGI